MSAMMEWLEEQVDESVQVHEAVRDRLSVVREVAGAVIETFRADGRVFFFGNGGSAADAQHWAAIARRCPRSPSPPTALR
jgi:D-sedoheptulose 7-phosphate isomerase